jgi:hypothetical protein
MENSGQKRPAVETLMGQRVSKKSRLDEEEDDDLYCPTEGVRRNSLAFTGRRAGRMTGAKGYSQKEIQVLFSLIKERPPRESAEWEELAMEYNAWAKKNKKPPRTGRGLKDKLLKIAVTSKDETTKSLPLNPVQQEARECLTLIHHAARTNYPDKDEIFPLQDYNCNSLDEQDKARMDSFHVAQEKNFRVSLQSLVMNLHSISNRVSHIEDILHNLTRDTDDGEVEE